MFIIATMGTRAAPIIIVIGAAIAGRLGIWRLGVMNNRRVNTGKCAVAIGSRDIHTAHHHLIHEQIGTPTQKLWAFLHMAAVAS
jgi:hypothetical protein